MYEQLSFLDVSCPKMPTEYIGQEKAKTNLTTFTPRTWTDEEINWCLNLKEQGWSIQEIADSVCRDKTSVSIKLKRLTKTNDTYNQDHLKQKYRMNDMFYEVVNPNEVLDVFCGKKHYWSDKCKCVSNDIDESVEADFHMDSLKFVCNEYLKGNKYDLVDLDPYGSAYDCFDLAIKMAKKALIVTYGELGHKRWKRLDYVRNTYEIENIEDFDIGSLIAKTQEIGRHNHKELDVWEIGKWRNVARVYYLIYPLKITEQWETTPKI